MGQYQYDVVVIGSGPGGEGAAMQAGKHGKKVAMVERTERIGGGCTHWDDSVAGAGGLPSSK